MHLERLLFEFLPNFVQDARRLIEFFLRVRIVLERELRNVRIGLLDEVLLVIRR